MPSRIEVRPEMLTWAIARAGFVLEDFINQNPRVNAWLQGERAPTVRQLEEFSKMVYVPLGYLLLPEPPLEQELIPFFRTMGKKDEKIHINVYDTILNIQQRQEWLRDYLIENDFQKLDFVGRFRGSYDVQEIVADIRKELQLEDHWASKLPTWEEAKKQLTQAIENIGVVPVFNGIVGNNTHRPIPVEECRGFVLVDKVAPFMFINNADWKSAQIFTLVHELAHIWIGESAGFDLKNFLPANDPIEKLCDQVAAEFLVPEDAFRKLYIPQNGFRDLARHFKVSIIVIARRALDLGIITKSEFFTFYNEYSKQEFIKKESQTGGGDFFANNKMRINLAFATHIRNAINDGQLLYRDAYRLTNLKGDTFSKFLSTQL